MLVRFPKLFAAAALLVALWGLSRVRSSGEEAWVRVQGSIPGKVRILLFQASVGSLTQGEKAQLCYGVANAKSVRIAPVSVRVYPSANRCVEIVPQHTTHYTILAEGFDGSVATKSFTLAVQAAPSEPEQPVQFAGCGSVVAAHSSGGLLSALRGAAGTARVNYGWSGSA